MFCALRSPRGSNEVRNRLDTERAEPCSASPLLPPRPSLLRHYPALIRFLIRGDLVQPEPIRG